MSDVTVTLKSGEKVKCYYSCGLDFWPVNGHPSDSPKGIHSYTDLAIKEVDGIPSNTWLRKTRNQVGIIDRIRDYFGYEMRGY